MADLARLRRTLTIWTVVAAAVVLLGIIMFISALSVGADAVIWTLIVVLIVGGAALLLWLVASRLRLERQAGEAAGPERLAEGAG
jgi:hypothetical protein